MGKLEGRVAVITGGSSGLALASAKRFVEEGAYVFITGRRQEALDEAVKLIGRNVTGVRGDAANLDDLDRLFDTVKREKGKIDVLFASAGKGEAAKLGEITEQHFDAAFDTALLERPGNKEIQLDLFLDYASNITLYPKFQEYFRKSKPPLLAIWGKNAPFFIPQGAEAFRKDLPNARVQFLDTGHFAIETHVAEIAEAMNDFLAANGIGRGRVELAS